MPNWSVAFFATSAFGRISIPILPDSSENEVTNIINHSESSVIFVSKRLAGKISPEPSKPHIQCDNMLSFVQEDREGQVAVDTSYVAYP